jgi:predicted dehydrogenase
VRIYLIGAGVIARTHAATSARLGEPIELRVADPSPDALAGFVDAFPDTRSFVSAREMLSSEPASDDDIVIVATPPFAHAESADAALESGRNVLCEKPLAMTNREADEMLRKADRYGRLLGCCSTRFSGLPHTEAVKRVLASGILGDVYHVSFINRWSRSRSGIEYQPNSRWFLDSSLSGGGVLMDWGPYDISTFDDIFTPDRVEIADAWTSRIRTGADPAWLPFDVETKSEPAWSSPRASAASTWIMNGHRPVILRISPVPRSRGRLERCSGRRSTPMHRSSGVATLTVSMSRRW